MKLILIGIIAVVAIGYLYSCTDKRKKTSADKTQSTEKSIKQNPYMEMRNMAFTAKAEQISLENIADDKVYGLITEIAMNSGSTSVISFLSGDTSLYLSTGSVFIGAGEHEEVRELVKEKVDGFQKYLSKAHKIDQPKLPIDGTVNFNFLTKNGIFSITENMKDIESGKSELTSLFIEVNEIITQIRLKSDG